MIRATNLPLHEWIFHILASPGRPPVSLFTFSVRSSQMPFAASAVIGHVCRSAGVFILAFIYRHDTLIPQASFIIMRGSASLDKMIDNRFTLWDIFAGFYFLAKEITKCVCVLICTIHFLCKWLPFTNSSGASWYLASTFQNVFPCRPPQPLGQGCGEEVLVLINMPPGKIQSQCWMHVAC